MSTLYHGSDTGGLERLLPRPSSHGRAYLYAAVHQAIALLFMARWNDFLLTLLDGESGGRLQLTLVERYAGALSDTYGGRGGFLYTLPGKGFFQPPGLWKLEYVSTEPVIPLACTPIDDLWTALREQEKDGSLTLYTYPDRPACIPKDDSDMVQKALALYASSGDAHNAVYCMQRFPSLAKRIRTAFQKEYGIQLPENLPGT